MNANKISSHVAQTAFYALIGLVFLSVSPHSYALCAAHDHNCFHGSAPFNPKLEDIQTGTGDLTITSKWEGEADINQHVELPDTVDPQTGQLVHGPFVSSNSDGNPVKTSPLGNDPNIVNHNQQNVQFSRATANANLTSDTQGAATSPNQIIQREEKTNITGNVPSGRYKIALQSYNIRNNTASANVQTTISAGQDGFFVDEGAQQAAINNSGHIPLPDSTGTATELQVNNTVAANANSQTQEFNYRYANFDQHANGVYVIPDGVWNMHGVDPQQVYQFGSADRTQGFLLNQGYQFEANPFDMSRVDIEGYAEWFYDANSGVYLALDDNQFTRVATDPREFTVLQTGLYTPVEIMQQYDLDAISTQNGQGRGDVRDFSRQHYDAARKIIGCADCSTDKLFQVLREIESGSNVYGLNTEGQNQYSKSISRAYSSASYYRSLKQDYRKGVVTNKIGEVINAVVQYFTVGIVSVGLDYRGDRLYGDANSIIIPGDCAQPPCNGSTQNNIAKVFTLGDFGGSNILRVDTEANTLQVNDGKVINASIYDIGNDGKEETQQHLEVSEGGLSGTVGVGYAGFGVNVTKGPDGTTYGAGYSYSYGSNQFSVGISCQSGGDCGERVGYTVTPNANGNSAFAGVYYDTRTGAGANVGYQHGVIKKNNANGDHVGGLFGVAGFDTQGGLYSTTRYIKNDTPKPRKQTIDDKINKYFGLGGEFPFSGSTRYGEDTQSCSNGKCITVVRIISSPEPGISTGFFLPLPPTLHEQCGGNSSCMYKILARQAREEEKKLNNPDDKYKKGFIKGVKELIDSIANTEPKEVLKAVDTVLKEYDTAYKEDGFGGVLGLKLSNIRKNIKELVALKADLSNAIASGNDEKVGKLTPKIFVATLGIVGNLKVTRGNATNRGGSVGAMRRNTFEPSPKHGASARNTSKGVASRGPKDGQHALDTSVQVKSTSPRRVGVDKANGEIIVFDQTSNGVFHGHVRSYKDLTSQQQNALKRAGLVDKKGKF